jgi:hypothetical protein
MGYKTQIGSTNPSYNGVSLMTILEMEEETIGP